MSTRVGSIHYDLDLDKTKFDRKTASLKKDITDIGKKVGLALGAAAAATATFGLKTAADLESSRQGFVTLLKSADKADETMARIKREAARTPFEIAGLTRATQLLASVTKDGNKSIEILLDVGESLAAMGKGQEELDRIIVNLQQIGSAGRATMLDIRQFAFAGIPIFELLEEQTGKTGEALQDMISDGGITFELLVEMFQRATDEGGQFFGAFENQSGTFNQLLSNMKDNFMIFASDFVTQTGLFDRAKEALASFGNFIQENKEQIIEYGRKGVGLVVKLLEGFINASKNIIKVVAPMISKLLELKDVFIALGVSMAVIKTANLMSVAFAGITAAIAPVIAAVKAAIVTFTLATASMGLMKGTFVSLTAVIAANPLGAAVVALSLAFAGLNKALTDSTNATIKQLEADSKLQEQLAKNASDTYKNAADAFNTIASAASNFNNELKKLTDTSDRVQILHQELSNVIRQFGAESQQAKDKTAELRQAEAELAQIEANRVNTLQELKDKIDAAEKSNGALKNTQWAQLEANRASLEAIKATMRARGEDTSAIDRMIGRIDALNKRRVNIDIKTNATAVENKINRVRNSILNLPSFKDIYVNITKQGSGLQFVGGGGLSPYATGGYTGRGPEQQIAGIVHKGEYVVPKSQVDQKTGMPKSMGTTINGNINIGNKTDADYFFTRLNRSQQNAGFGLSSLEVSGV